jgi:RNA polymerase-binding transcription factor DksA
VVARAERAAHHLTDEDLDDLRSVLAREHLTLEAQLSEFDAALQAMPAATAEAVAERDLAEAHASRTREAIAAIRVALERLADGTYGVCVDCGSPIPLERLEALPEAAFCVACPRVRGLRR